MSKEVINCLSLFSKKQNSSHINCLKESNRY